MYHALYSSAEELEAIDPGDRPYAVAIADFRAQLGWLADAGIPIVEALHVARGPEAAPVSVVLTFDDGHESNYRLAFPLLAKRSWPAAFFVTSDFIGKRRGFCNWTQLREMREAGMQIGAHGATHRFFDDLQDAETIEEFARPRAVIEAETGAAPRMMSFPGGRYRRDQLVTGEAAGYELFFSSDVGSNRLTAFRQGGLLRRVAVRRSTDADQFRAMASGASLPLARAQAVASAKGIARSILGNRLYHALYERFSG